MIEHRLYSVERFVPNRRIESAGVCKEDLVIMTPKKAAWYALQGYTTFDFNKSLDMDPIYYEQEQEIIMNKV